jgi:uncharacterized membrane protein
MKCLLSELFTVRMRIMMRDCIGLPLACPERSLLPHWRFKSNHPSDVTSTMEKEMEMNSRNSVAAIYDTHDQAEHAVKELQEAGVDMKSLSIVGRDTHTDEHVVGYYTAGDRMMYWGKVGAFWGGFWGLLFGSGLFFIPGLGPILAAGPIVAWIVAGLEGAVVVGGVSAIGAGLISLGIPKDSVLKYDVALKTDKYVLVVHGTPEEVEKAKDIIAGTEQSHYAVYGQAVLV